MKGESREQLPVKAAIRAFQLLAADCGCRQVAIRAGLDLITLLVAIERGILAGDAAGNASGRELARSLECLPEPGGMGIAHPALVEAAGILGEIPACRLTPRLAGDLYQELLETPLHASGQRKSLRSQRRQQGSFFTPAPIINEIMDLAFAPTHPELTICDPAMGAGHFLLAVVGMVLDDHGLEQARDFAGKRLFGMDRDPEAARHARHALWLLLSRPGELFEVPQDHFQAMDSLLAPLPWPEIKSAGGVDIIIGNPPYDVLTNFSRNPQAKAYAEKLRSSIHFRLSLKGQLNLYRCFIERSLQLLRPGGVLSFVVPASLLMDRVAAPLRRELLLYNCMDQAHVLDESDHAFSGVQQAVVVFRARKDKGRAESIRVNGCRVALGDLRSLGQELPVVRATKEDWRLIRWLAENAPRIFSAIARGAVGEVDQTVFARHMRDKDTGTLLLRGCHVKSFAVDLEPRASRQRFLDADGFLRQKGRVATDCKERVMSERVVQLGIRNLQSHPRLVAARVPAAVFLGNSVNQWLPASNASNVSCDLLLGLLNSRLYDWRFRLTSSNNNINVCEVNTLPLPRDLEPRAVGRVEAAVRACERAAVDLSGSGDLAAARHALDETVFELFGLPLELRVYLSACSRSSHCDI